MFEDVIKSGQKRIFFASTYEAHPLAVVAAIEVQKIVQSRELLQHVNEVGVMIKSQLLDGLGDHDFFKNVRGRGMLMSLEYDCKDRDSFNFELEKRMLENHRVILGSKYHRTNFNPPSTTSKKQVENVVAKFVETFIEVSKKFSI